MRKLFLTLVALFFTLPAHATPPSHWTCSNDSSVLYLVIGGDNSLFFLFDDKGNSLGSSTFVRTKTNNGVDFSYAELDGVSIGAKRINENTLILLLTKQGQPVVRFDCN